MHGSVCPWSRTYRTLHLIDLENLAGAAHASAEALRNAGTAYHRIITIADSDHVWVACNPRVALHSRAAFPGSRMLVGHGHNGADKALLDAFHNDDVVAKYDLLVIASGDGIFTGIAAEFRLTGRDVVVTARPGAIANRLRRVATIIKPFSLPPEPSKAAAMIAA